MKSQTWELWQECNYDEDKGMPLPRSGHSASIHGHFMLIYGGIIDITKELDDLLIYDLEKRKWIQLFDELLLSPIK